MSHVIMLPQVVVSEDKDVIFFGSIDKKKYFVVTQYHKCTFLDGGFSVSIGSKKALKPVKISEQKMENRGDRVFILTEEGKFQFFKDSFSWRYKGTFKGKNIKLYSCPR